MFQTVRYEVQGALATITLDDPSTRNALGPDAADLIMQFARAAGADNTVRLLALTGSGGVFCSGAAIRAWEALPDAGETLTDRGTELCDLLENLPIPVVACLSGHAVGGGAELALAADWRIVSPAAEFRFVHTGFGLVPGFGGLARLELIVGRAAALRLLATRATVESHDAVALGLANAVVPIGDQQDWLVEMTTMLEGSPRGAVAAIKHAFATGDERSAFLRVWPDRELPERFGS